MTSRLPIFNSIAPIDENRLPLITTNQMPVYSEPKKELYKSRCHKLITKGDTFEEFNVRHNSKIVNTLRIINNHLKVTDTISNDDPCDILLRIVKIDLHDGVYTFGPYEIKCGNLYNRCARKNCKYFHGYDDVLCITNATTKFMQYLNIIIGIIHKLHNKNINVMLQIK